MPQNWCSIKKNYFCCIAVQLLGYYFCTACPQGSSTYDDLNVESPDCSCDRSTGSRSGICSNFTPYSVADGSNPAAFAQAGRHGFAPDAASDRADSADDPVAQGNCLTQAALVTTLPILEMAESCDGSPPFCF